MPSLLTFAVRRCGRAQPIQKSQICGRVGYYGRRASVNFFTSRRRCLLLIPMTTLPNGSSTQEEERARVALTFGFTRSLLDGNATPLQVKQAQKYNHTLTYLLRRTQTCTYL